MCNKIISLTKTFIFWVASYNCVKHSSFFSPEQTVEYVIKNKKSLIRYGDGEIFFTRTKSLPIHYQDFSAELSRNLNNILQDFIENPETCDYLVCMPGAFLSCSGLKILSRRVYIRSWIYPRYAFKKNWDTSVKYGDAFLFVKRNCEHYEKLWASDSVKNIIFVHNDIKYAKQFKETYHKNVEFVHVPPKNAFEKKDVILADILAYAEKFPPDMVLVSAGPCAKLLVRDLSQKGLWAIDAGHCWDEPLEI